MTDKRPLYVLKGVKLEPGQIAAIKRYCDRRSRIVGFEVRFSTAVRCLIEAGLDAATKEDKA